MSTYSVLQEVPLPSGGFFARRTGQWLCLADKESYNVINLETATMIAVLPVSQAQDGLQIKPSITVISDNEFLIDSWTGASSLGLFITGEGEPVRGTLEWPAHPDSISESFQQFMCGYTTVREAVSFMIVISVGNVLLSSLPGATHNTLQRLRFVWT